MQASFNLVSRETSIEMVSERFETTIHCCHWSAIYEVTSVYASNETDFIIWGVQCKGHRLDPQIYSA